MNIVVLTGAGISAESGISTFRDSDGLWEGYDVNEVCTPQGYAANPDLVHQFYADRRAALLNVQPNPAHEALAALERGWAAHGDFLLVTQNIDDLHDRAGSHNLLHMHGELATAWCLDCDTHPPSADTTATMTCPNCGGADLRPDICFFGEIPRGMDVIEAGLSKVDLFVSIGTSGHVYPAAGMVHHANSRGARTLELNLVPSEGSRYFSEARHGPASELVPAWVEELLGG